MNYEINVNMNEYENECTCTQVWLLYIPIYKILHTVTPFKFAAIKVCSFDIMTDSRPFNFAVSYQNYFTVSYTHVVFFYTN